MTSAPDTPAAPPADVPDREQTPAHTHSARCRCKKTTAPAPPDRYVYAATVAKVVDADTVDLVVDVGFGISHTIRARLAGVYAPELGTAEGEAAREFTAAWLDQHGPQFWVRTFRDRKERYGRYLVTITTATDPDGLGAALVAAGHASTA